MNETPHSEEPRAAVHHASIYMLREAGYLTDEDPADAEIREALHRYEKNLIRKIEK